jgi:hypothetical protein
MARQITTSGAEYSDSGSCIKPPTGIRVLNADGTEFGTFETLAAYEAHCAAIGDSEYLAMRAAWATEQARNAERAAAYEAKKAADRAAGDRRPSFMKKFD